MQEERNDSPQEEPSQPNAEARNFGRGQGQRNDATQPERSEAAKGERRSKHRVSDDQGSGKGSATALSKLRMLERRRNSITPRRDGGN